MAPCFARDASVQASIDGVSGVQVSRSPHGPGWSWRSTGAVIVFSQTTGSAQQTSRPAATTGS